MPDLTSRFGLVQRPALLPNHLAFSRLEPGLLDELRDRGYKVFSANATTAGGYLLHLTEAEHIAVFLELHDVADVCSVLSALDRKEARQ